MVKSVKLNKFYELVTGFNTKLLLQGEPVSELIYVGYTNASL